MNYTKEQLKVLEMVQKYIDKNNVYQVEFGHYDNSPPHGYGKWVPCQTHRINIKEVFSGK